MPRPLLSHISVEKLFGRFTYEIEVPRLDDEFGRLLLIYGENGSGKTTILRLIWNLLSAADDQGHRTNLARAPFRKLSVAFNDGTRLSVSKSADLVGSFDIAFATPGKSSLTARYEVDETLTVKSNPVGVDLAREIERSFAASSSRFLLPGKKNEYTVFIENEMSKERYIRLLDGLEINPILLADDRRIYSDQIGLERKRSTPPPDTAAGVNRRSTTASRQVQSELKTTINRVSNVLLSLTLGGQSLGFSSANTIYLNILREMAGQRWIPKKERTPPNSGSRRSDQSEVAGLLSTLAERSPRFAKFELAPLFDAETFSRLLDAVEPSQRELAQNIVAPYLNSLREQYDALDEAENLLRTLLPLINDRLDGKSFSYTPRSGLRVSTDDGVELEPDQLSSGERQLVMLLCTAFLARRDSRLLIIDEPELSLGLDWQREILDSLLTLTTGTAVQFVVATHSVEVITGQRRSLVQLPRRKDKN